MSTVGLVKGTRLLRDWTCGETLSCCLLFLVFWRVPEDEDVSGCTIIWGLLRTEAVCFGQLDKWNQTIEASAMQHF